ncbi:MAG: ParB/RepB/Spo0J family partition protein, partial [Betaproteobacteria bacterium]|nr:ParB/RepB/Spo0J family partition protein [Betaproteobacteria bacterium]
MSGKKKGLGRGLEALLGVGAGFSQDPEGRLTQLPLSALEPGQYQPRRSMDEAGLEELAQSIREQGVLQPILVRALAPGRGAGGADGRYEILAGERRFQAAKRAGLDEIPVIVKALNDQAALAVALIENLQRQDLSALEEAQGISRLIEEFGLTHDQAAQAVGRSRSATSNLLRLLALPKAIQDHLAAGRLEAGHARALLPLPAAQQRALALVDGVGHHDERLLHVEEGLLVVVLPGLGRAEHAVKRLEGAGDALGRAEAEALAADLAGDMLVLDLEHGLLHLDAVGLGQRELGCDLDLERVGEGLSARDHGLGAAFRQHRLADRAQLVILHDLAVGLAQQLRAGLLQQHV